MQSYSEVIVVRASTYEFWGGGHNIAHKRQGHLSQLSSQEQYLWASMVWYHCLGDDGALPALWWLWGKDQPQRGGTRLWGCGLQRVMEEDRLRGWGVRVLPESCVTSVVVVLNLLTTNCASQVDLFCDMKYYYVFFTFESMKGKLQRNGVVSSDIERRTNWKCWPFPQPTNSPHPQQAASCCHGDTHFQLRWRGWFWLRFVNVRRLELVHQCNPSGARFLGETWNLEERREGGCRKVLQGPWAAWSVKEVRASL